MVTCIRLGRGHCVHFPGLGFGVLPAKVTAIADAMVPTGADKIAAYT